MPTFSSLLPTNHPFSMFLSYAVKVFNQVLVDLQAEEPVIHVLRASQCALLRDLDSRFLEPVAVFNVPVEKVTPSSFIVSLIQLTNDK